MSCFHSLRFIFLIQDQKIFFFFLILWSFFRRSKKRVDPWIWSWRFSWTFDFDPSDFHDPLIFIIVFIWSYDEIHMILWIWTEETNRTRAAQTTSLRCLVLLWVQFCCLKSVFDWVLCHVRFSQCREQPLLKLFTVGWSVK